MGKSSKTKTTTNDNVKSQVNNESKGKFKSGLVKKLVDKVKSLKDKVTGKDDIKDKKAISLSDIIGDIENMSDADIKNVCADIKEMNLKVGMDAKSIQLLTKYKDNENVKKLLKELNMSMNLDISSISKFRKKDIATVREVFEGTGCKIDKVYVNAGWDEASKQGYTFGKYEKIVGNAEKMLDKALSKLPENASKKDKFMAIYNAVLKTNNYDYSALRENSPRYYTSRNLEGFFLDNGSCVCAGTALALQSLLECAGMEKDVEYVQGYGGKGRNAEYHAWNKVRLDDGRWYNCDATWDANKVAGKYGFCLKSDKEFRDHREDKSYNPTYERGGGAQRYKSTTRTYHTSDRSENSEALNRKYYDSDVDKAIHLSHERMQSATVSEEYLKHARENKIPVNVSAVGQMSYVEKLTFKQKLAKFLSKFSHIKELPAIKKFIAKNEIVEKNVDKKEENEKAKKGQPQKSMLEEIKVPPEQCQYNAKQTNTVQKSAPTKSSEGREI